MEKQFLQSLVVCRLFLLKGIYSVAVILHLASMLLFSLIYHSELGRGRKSFPKTANPTSCTVWVSSPSLKYPSCLSKKISK